MRKGDIVSQVEAVPSQQGRHAERANAAKEPTAGEGRSRRERTPVDYTSNRVTGSAPTAATASTKPPTSSAEPPAASAGVPMTEADARRLAAEEGLTFMRAPGTDTGYTGVSRKGRRFSARSRQGGHVHHLGRFDTAEEAALTIARHAAEARRLAAVEMEEGDDDDEEGDDEEMEDNAERPTEVRLLSRSAPCARASSLHASLGLTCGAPCGSLRATSSISLRQTLPATLVLR